MKTSEQLRIRSQVNNSLKKLLIHLSSGKAHTLIELIKSTKTSKSKLNDILGELMLMNVVKTRKNRNHTYYYIENPEKIDFLKPFLPHPNTPLKIPSGMKYSRHCYKHLAGYVGVKLEEALIRHNFIIRQDLEDDYNNYRVTPEGWEWFSQFGISKESIESSGGRLTKQCLDFSERKSHLGGKLGDALLGEFFEKGWVYQVPDSREVKLTEAGKKGMLKELGINLTPFN